MAARRRTDPRLRSNQLAASFAGTYDRDDQIDSFFEVWRSADRFEGRSTFSTWLLAIARNKAFSALERRHTVELEDEWAASVPDPADDREFVLQDKDLGEVLRRCLASLSSKDTEIIDLVDLP